MKILLVGPSVDGRNASYGGGAGGYVRNMQVYLSHLSNDEYSVFPCFHTIRKSGRFWLARGIFRIFIDIAIFTYRLLVVRPQIVHILAQYRSAIPREFCYVVIAKVFGCSIFYEIKAGSFVSEYRHRGRVYKKMISFVLRCVNAIGIEGEAYRGFLKTEFGRTATLIPNCVPNVEIPTELGCFPGTRPLRVLFVGFCYEGKGVFELVKGCEILSQRGHPVELTLLGALSDSFAEWISDFRPGECLKLQTPGKVSHETVIQTMENSSVFCLASKHPGEGHNNSVNEAMMRGAIVVCSRQGFLADIIDEKTGFLLEQVEETVIANALEKVIKATNFMAIRQNAFQKLKGYYSSSHVMSVIHDCYDRILHRRKL